MPRIHYFQRYSSLENTATNNTLLLLARIYDYSPRVASTLLSELTDEPIQIGIEIAQQRRAQNSVPDGAIIQRSFKILIEAKVGANENLEQLERHAKSFGNEAQKILLLLTKNVDQNFAQNATTRLRNIHSDIIFRNITYEDICNSTRSLFKEHESEMQDLVDDYAEYCNDEELVDQTRFLMRIVPCGNSIEVNRRFKLYFHPSDRGYTKHRFIGIYANRAVRAILEPLAVFDVTQNGTTLNMTLIQGIHNDQYVNDITNAIEVARTKCGYDLTSGHRFFCGIMTETHFRKTTPYGIQGPRIVNLKNYTNELADINLDNLANLLQNNTWC